MKIDIVEGMITAGMLLKSWDDSQSSGIWVALGDNDFLLGELQSKLNSGLQDNVELKTYFQGHGYWLPIALTDSLECSLKLLELKLKEMPKKIVDKEGDYRKEVAIAYKIITEDNLVRYDS
jgi:hypothetical protein